MTALDDLLDLLDLERIEDHIFRGRNRPLASPRVFGGQVLAQALVAADRTVNGGAGGAGRPCHSLHAYFILPGDVQAPIVYEVETLRDGRSFSTRRVTAVQHGRPIFNASLSFHVAEPGLDHQDDLGRSVDGPDGLASERDLVESLGDRVPEPLRTVLTRDRPFDYRPVDPADPLRPDPRPGTADMWLQATGPLPDDPAIHQALLAYASDWGLLGTALLPHGRSVFDGSIQAASLDHAIWFHRPFRADGWLLYAIDSPTAAGARGFTRGAVYDAEGRLVASAVQEGLVRPVDPSQAR
ncbi:acyl-CoA thioesterase [Rubrivirga litoralis]|uniref:Acyl-CoA thioesterase II n=1 Tax=Rubrivirga litoralis TaxID=3075598 RepID=A0ABU3BPS5_9BACT|nr:acyl-CoA thioesterase II [Rubrivirga sp. F394]MDT0631289.1 acyl-CoA thioesterase II [Rubrivirga sp. F394]